MRFLNLRSLGRDWVEAGFLPALVPAWWQPLHEHGSPKRRMRSIPVHRNHVLAMAHAMPAAGTPAPSADACRPGRIAKNRRARAPMVSTFHISAGRRVIRGATIDVAIGSRKTAPGTSVYAVAFCIPVRPHGKGGVHLNASRFAAFDRGFCRLRWCPSKDRLMKRNPEGR